MPRFKKIAGTLLTALFVTGCSGSGGYARLPQAYPKTSATAMNPWAQSRDAGLPLLDLGRKEEEANRRMRAVVPQNNQNYANFYVPDGINLADGQFSVQPIFGTPFFPMPRQIMDRVFAGTDFAVIAPDPGNRLICNTPSDARGRPQYFLQVTIDGLDQGAAFARKGISPFADDGAFSGDFNGGSTIEETSFFISAELRRCGTREGVLSSQTMVAVRRTTTDRGFFLFAKLAGVTYRDTVSDGVGLNRARNLALAGFLSQFATDAIAKLRYAPSTQSRGFEPDAYDFGRQGSVPAKTAAGFQSGHGPISTTALHVRMSAKRQRDRRRQHRGRLAKASGFDLHVTPVTLGAVSPWGRDWRCTRKDYNESVCEVWTSRSHVRTCTKWEKSRSRGRVCRVFEETKRR
jgi:hypothetical protein